MVLKRTEPPSATDVADPDPLTETPPPDRFCDLVITGGVASGVVYPWAIVELARRFRFRNIGGSSIGAVAAALAAASEYGRCKRIRNPFEVLRMTPHRLAEEDSSGITKMRRMFQPHPGGKRLFELLVDVVHRGRKDRPHGRRQLPEKLGAVALLRTLHERGYVCDALRQEKRWAICWLLSAAAMCALVVVPAFDSRWVLALAAPLVFILQAALLVWFVRKTAGAFVDIVSREVQQGVVDNDLGFCSGMSPEGEQDLDKEAFVQWMHRGIQKAAGLGLHDPPLTFRDLWTVEREGVDADRSINLEVMVANVTFGRPLRLPMPEGSTPLYYRLADWKGLFPQSVLDHLARVSSAYSPPSERDPVDPGTSGLLALPMAELPIVVAARMSMACPILFSTIPVWAIDSEAEPAQRRLRRCRLSDGGVCSNFPVHLFDAAIPRWPTFGLFLARRLPTYPYEATWLPNDHLSGRGENWFRFETDERARRPEHSDFKSAAEALGGFLNAVVGTAHGWPDRTRMRLPHVRGRVIRLALRGDEGSFFIGMSGTTILNMAREYGIEAGRSLCDAFASDDVEGRPTRAWREHLYIRAMTLLSGLRHLLDGYGDAVDESAHSMPLATVLRRAVQTEPVRRRSRRDRAAGTLSEARRLLESIEALRELERQLAAALTDTPYRPLPEVHLRLNPAG